MPSIRQSIRSSTASKRPTSAIADGQIALNTASGTPGIFFKDNANNIIKAGPAHYGASAPNSSPAVGGSTGNSIGEAWLDSSLTPAGWKIWNGSAWVNATPLSSDTVQGLVELATNAETQAGVDAARAVTAASLQSKVSDSISTTSASGIASSTAVKTAYDLANAALPKSGGIVTGNLEIGSTGSFTFEGSTADGFETTLAVVDPTADRTITFPNTTGTVVTTGDTGTVTSTMILDGTILNADINASAAIVDTKLATIATALKVSNSATTAASANTASAIVARDASGNFTAGTITAALTGAASSNVLKAGDTMTGVLAVTAGTAALPGIAVSGDINTGIYSPGADQLAISTNGTGRLFVNSSGNVGVGISTPAVSLDINNATGAYLRTGGSTVALELGPQAGSTGPGIEYNIDGTTWVRGRADAFPLAFKTNNTERMRLTSAGLVGIGTTSPGTILQCSGTGSQEVTLTSNTSGNARYSFDLPGVVYNWIETERSTSALKFAVANSERARIDSSGRLLVGTSSARSNYFNSINTALLQIEGTAGGSTRGMSSIVNNSTSDDPPWLLIGKSNGSSVGSNSIVGNGTILGVLGFAGNDGSEFVNAAFISAAVDGTPGANDMPGRLVFSVTADGSASPTEAMRINNAGELLVGYTTDNGAYKLQVNSQIFATSATIATSDGRYKENVASLGGCLDLVKALRPVSFTWKPQQDITRIDDEGNELLVREGHNFPEGTQVGFIAQEVQEALSGKPWLSSVIKENIRPSVKNNEGNELAPEERFFGIAEGNLIAVLTNALQESIAKIEALETRLSALEGN
jgi:hypothetical protein